ncbi:hypothetical protein E4U54_000551 [Claviceps lovelessii]|nr:hypothetical protein E4U54_000551 [Claviceps lovelessii]
MSSSHLSCGRKRSLLRTFGSRRRRKEFAVSSSIRTEAKSQVHGTQQLTVFTSPCDKLGGFNSYEGK